MTQKKPLQALEKFEKVLELNPNNQEALLFAGMIYSDKGQEEKAKLLYEKSLEINETNVVALNNLAFIFSSQPPLDLNRALELAQQAYKIAPQSGQVADTLGWIYFQQGRYAEALVYLRQAREALPKLGEVRYHLGKTYLHLQDAMNAKVEFQEALRLEPKAFFVAEVKKWLESEK